MQDNNKIYGESDICSASPRIDEWFVGYTISLVEWEATIPSLWSTVKGV